MKKILLLLALCLPVLSQAQKIMSYGNSLATTTAPERTVVNTTDGLIVTYKFNGAKITKDPLYRDAYRWKIDGFSESHVVSEPATLTKIDQIRIPQGMEASVSIISKNGKSYDYELAPARPNLIQGSNVAYTLNNVKPVSSYMGYYPASPIEDKGVSYYRGNGILNVAVHPIEYNMQQKSVYAYDEISYKVTFSAKAQSRARGARSAEEEMDVKNDADEYLSETTVTNEDLIDKSNAVENNKSILFVTVDKFLPSVERLAAWKNMLGYKTYIESGIGWTPEMVKQTVAKHYHENNINYLIIFGDSPDVPGAPARTPYIYQGEARECTNDFYYACMDGEDDYIADIRRGRIAVAISRTNEAEIAVDKIINYEKTPISDPTFWKSGLHCAYFDDFYNDETGEFVADGKEDGLNVFTSEYVKGLMEEYLDFDVKRIYTADNTVNPVYDFMWEELPEELQRPNYPWKATYKDITNELVEGKAYVMYTGHGDQLGDWVSPSFSGPIIRNKLKNGDKLPFVFSFACGSGDYTQKIACLGEMWLRVTNAGGIGCLAPSNDCLAGPDDYFAWKLFIDLINGNSDGTPYTIGELIDRGLDFMAPYYMDDNAGLYEKDAYHWFGDPTMYLNTSVPTAFEDVKVSFVDDKVYVSLADSCEATITLVDSVNNIVKSYIGNRASFVLTDPNTTSADICVSGFGKIPFIQHVVRGDIEAVAYDAIARNLNVSYDIVGTKEATIKVINDGEVIAEEALDLSSDSISLDVLLKPATYTVEISAEGLVLDTYEVEGTSYFDAENDDWAGIITIDYEIADDVQNAQIKMFKKSLMFFGPEYSVARVTKKLDLTNEKTGTVTINTSLMEDDDFALYLVEDGKYTYYSAVSIAPVGPKAEIAIDDATVTETITGKYKFVYGTNPKNGYIRLYSESVIKSVWNHFDMLIPGKAAYSQEIVLDSASNRIDGTFSISTDNLANGKYYVVLYSEDGKMPLTYETVEVNKPVIADAANKIISVKRVDGNLVIEYQLDENATSASIVVTNVSDTNDNASAELPVGTTNGTIQIAVSSENVSDIYAINLIVDGESVENNKFEVK